MKKTAIIAGAGMLILVCILALTGCPTETKPSHRDPSFLIGTWEGDRGYFTIHEDHSFNATVNVAMNPADPADITKVDVEGDIRYDSKYDRDDYTMENLESKNSDPILKSQLENLNGTKITIKPKSGNTEFTFSSSGLAQTFWGGEYTKTKVPD